MTTYMYALVDTTSKEPSICYRMAPSARELWREIIAEEFLGTAHTRDTLRRRGWRAKRVRVEVLP